MVIPFCGTHLRDGLEGSCLLTLRSPSPSLLSLSSYDPFLPACASTARMSTGPLLPPSTKGGFSNDGSAVMADSSSSSAAAAATATDGRSHVLTHSALSLEAFYEVPRIIAFLRARRSRICALQFPDDQLSDAVPLTDALRKAWNENNNANETNTESSSSGISAIAASESADLASTTPCPAFYILGDTSYASCCVDAIAAAHVKADALVHFGLACFSPAPESLPVLHVTGAAPASAAALAAAANALASQSALAPLFPTSSSDDANKDNNKYLLVLYDQRLRRAIPTLAAAVAANGVRVHVRKNNCCNNNSTSNTCIMDTESATSASNTPHPYTIVFADMPDDADANSCGNTPNAPCPHTANTSSTVTVAKTAAKKPSEQRLSFAGYSWPALPAPPRAPRRRRSLWKRCFAPGTWAVLVLTLPVDDVADAGALRAAESAARTGGFGVPRALAAETAGALSPRSATLLALTVLNFTMHTVASLAVTSDAEAEANEMKTSAGDVTLDDVLAASTAADAPAAAAPVRLESGARPINATLSRRVYLIEKAKNAHVFALVVSAVSGRAAPAAVARAEAVITEAGRKSYTVCVGKLNEPKLLNFAEVEVFVMVACPVSVLLQDHSNMNSTDVVTPLELEFALCPDRPWTGFYSTDCADVDEKSGRLGRKLVGEAEYDPDADYDGNSSGDDNNGEDGDGSDWDSSSEDDDGEQNGDSEIADDDEEYDETAPRFSVVDQKFHAPITTKAQRARSNGAAGGSKTTEDTTAYGLVEVGPAALTDAGYKPHQRSFTGLDAAADPAVLGTVIRAGLFGTAAGYVTQGTQGTAEGADKK